MATEKDALDTDTQRAVRKAAGSPWADNIELHEHGPLSRQAGELHGTMQFLGFAMGQPMALALGP
ncbi:hypothetical protein LOZ53_006883, partial [Ophidiomyces ophidiicola]